MCHYTGYERDTCFREESWNKKVTHGLVRPQLAACVGSSRFPRLCECPRMAVSVLQGIDSGLTNQYCWVGEFANTWSANKEGQLCFLSAQILLLWPPTHFLKAINYPCTPNIPVATLVRGSSAPGLERGRWWKEFFVFHNFSLIFSSYSECFLLPCYICTVSISSWGALMQKYSYGGVLPLPTHYSWFLRKGSTKKKWLSISLDWV